MHNRFPKGSTWKKWDLHVHTPASILYQNFGQDWDKYVTNLFKKAFEQNVQAIGITDYYTIDGYAYLKENYLNNPDKLEELFDESEITKINNMLIFPNIEFRIDKLVMNTGFNEKLNRKVNYHLLLSDELEIKDIQENLLQQIEFETLAVPGQGEQKSMLTKSNLERLGVELKNHHAPFRDYSDLFVGMMNACVNVGQIQKVLQRQAKIFQGKYFFAVPADEDLSIISWDNGGHNERKLLLQKAHIILSSNSNTSKFGLGGFHENEEAYIKEFNSLKPCLWGSDAHDFEKLFLPDEERNTWIKADLTFEGLKAVIFEPKGRVKIQVNEPESKPAYQVIDKIRFADHSEKDTFCKGLIEFNENLNTIIGGKSSGKSLLLHHIARAIDPHQVKEKEQQSVSNYQKFRVDSPFNIEVYWKDGSKNILDEAEEKNGQITYIPQLYINHLAEQGGRDELLNLIESILLQNTSYSEFKEGFKTERQRQKDTMHRCIQELLRLTDAVVLKQKEIQQIGTIQQLTAEKQRLIEQIKLLTKQSGLTEDQVKEYTSLEEEKRKYEAALNRARERVIHFQKMKTSFGVLSSDVVSNIEHQIEEYAIPEDEGYQRIVATSKTALVTGINKSFEDFIKTIDEQLSKLNQNITNGQKILNGIIEKLKPFVQIAKNKETLKGEQKKLSAIEAKTIQHKTKTDDFKKLIEQGKKNNEKLFEAYNALYGLYKNYLEEVGKPEFSKIDDGLFLKARLVFDGERFSESFSGLFDRRGNFNQIFNATFDEYNQFTFNEQSHVGNIKTIFEKVRSRNDTNLRLRVGMNEDEKYHRLFDDYFKIEYSIEHKGDNILSMSPGKRGLVLLQLILHISTATHPILIDQPEDNLDNRTIFFDLKDFIKNKKSNRQIIIVTHNANLVVATDAECIIVANQDGQQAGKDNRKYKFEYISGALENTFADDAKDGVLYQKGIKEHVCDVLEGGKEAFQMREQKYGFSYLK